MCCVLSFRVTCIFAFHYSGVDAMGGGLKGINQDKRKDDISLNIFKFLPSLEEAWKLDALISLASDNVGSE